MSAARTAIAPTASTGMPLVACIPVSSDLSTMAEGRRGIKGT
jgi:hypothetical protein